MSPVASANRDDSAAAAARAELEAQIAAVAAEVKRREWLDDPVLWCIQRLGETVWSKQRDILYSIRDNRFTSVPSCHAAGKSFIAARAALWWINTHPPGTAKVVTTATTWRQVENVLWMELRRAHARGKLPGRCNRTELLLPIVGSDESAASSEEIVAFGHRPADTDPTAFQGIHERYVLVIFDEACGIPKALWDSAIGLVANEESRFLVIGNPDDPLSEFANVSEPGSGWHTIHISALDTPNFTDEDVPDEMRRRLCSQLYRAEAEKRWGLTNPLYIAKVLGEFPPYGEDGLIPMKWVRDAQQRYNTTAETHPVEMGVDLGAGGDKNVFCVRKGAKARVVNDDREPNTIATANKVRRYARQESVESIKIDYIGIGRGAVDYLKLQEVADKRFVGALHGIQVGQPADDNAAFANRRAEGFWHLRQLFQDGGIAIDPTDDDLAAQLLDLRYESTPQGRIILESKESMRRRGKNSPDRADALMLAFLPERKKRKTSATWGRQ